jgi:hypothetical protein
MNPSNSLNVDKIVAYLLSDLVIHKRTNGILVNICNADIPVKELEIFTKKYPEVKFNSSSVISVTVREHFFKLVSLKDFLEKDPSEDNFKNSIFQVLHTLDVIQSMFPTFRHNNLTIDTIMVYETNERPVKYKVGSTEFNLKIKGETKITNFLNSNIKDYITNDSLESKMQEPNKIYDVEMFLESLMVLELPSEIKNLIKKSSDKTAREILLKEFDLTQTGGAKKKKSKSKSKTKSKKYSMSQAEVDKILDLETDPEPEKEQEQEVEPEPETNNNLNVDPVQQVMQDLKSKPNIVEYNHQEKFVQKPINIPGTNMQLKQQETTDPIIQVNLPAPPPLPTNGLSSLMGDPGKPSTGIMNAFGVNTESRILTLHPNVHQHNEKLITENQSFTLENKNGDSNNIGVKLVGPNLSGGGSKKKRSKRYSRRHSISQEDFDSIMSSPTKNLTETPTEQTVNFLKSNKPASNVSPASPEIHRKPETPDHILAPEPQSLNTNSIAAKLQQINNTNKTSPTNVPNDTAPLNVIPNPFKTVGTDGHSILGKPDQKGGAFNKNSLSFKGGVSQNGVERNQNGGAERIIPIYKNTKNSPYKSNEEKRNQQERYYEQHPEQERLEKQERNYEERERNYEEREKPRGLNLSKSVFELKVAPELLPQPPMVFPKAQPDQIVKNYILPAPGAPINQVQNNSIANQVGQMNSHPEANVIAQNTYNISFSNPSKVREFREDILPSRDESMLKYTMNTISERMIIYSYLRSILIRQNDGENINFISDKSPEVRNLLSYLRIIDVQLTKNDKITNNPLGDLPRRLIMYSSCYPIRVDRANYNVGCAKNNIGINIRIYQMIMGETFVNKYRSLPYKVFEVWREISLYEQLRDNIIKSNLSPNFGILYSYYITKDTEIDFLKINRLRNKDIVSKQEKAQKLLLNNSYKKEMQDYLVGLQKYSTADLTKLIDDLDINKPSDKCLIALTEAGTHDLITWSSRQYEDNGLAKKMINTGYHAAEVWQSILFQMFQGLLCMYKMGISFETFDLNSNVMVKSLKTDEMNKGYWRYRINGIDFYIPNYGYMVLINPDFADIKSNDEKTIADYGANVASALADRVNPVAAIFGLGASPVTKEVILQVLDNNSMRQLDNVVYKVYSNELLINQTEFNLNRNKLRSISNMKSAFDNNIYNKEYTLNGGVKPDSSIEKIIIDINQELTSIVNIEKTILDNAKKAQEDAIKKDLPDTEIQEIIRVASAYPGSDVEYTAKITAYVQARDDEKAARVAENANPQPGNTANLRATADASRAAANLNPPSEYTINVTDKLLKIIINKFKNFLHNRTGTSLKEGEQANLIESDDLRTGELVACLDNRRWGIITRISAGNYDVFTVDEPAGIDNNITAKLKSVTYNIGDLRRSTLLVEQISKPNQKLSDSDLLETYDLSL